MDRRPELALAAMLLGLSWWAPGFAVAQPEPAEADGQQAEPAEPPDEPAADEADEEPEPAAAEGAGADEQGERAEADGAGADAPPEAGGEPAGGLDAPPGPASADEQDSLPADVLALCRSSDVSARRFCLRRLGELDALDARARAELVRMASSDPALHEEAAAQFGRRYAASPPAYVPSSPAERPPEAPDEQAAIERAEHGDPYRVVFAPNAFIRRPGTRSFNAYELGSFQFDLGLTENFQLGIQTAIPAGAIAVGVVPRIGYEFPGGAIAMQANLLEVFIFPGSSFNVLLFGAGPVLTLGSRDLFFNAGFHAGGIHVSDVRDALAGYVVAHTGVSGRLGDHVRLGLEGWIPFVIDGGDAEFLDFGLILAGLRFFNDRFWGDIALAQPICDGCGELYEILPVGIPFLNFGFSWGEPASG